MSFTFRPAIRENVGLFIGLAGYTGCGKTWSAMEIAEGVVGADSKFAVIDTENKRASHYADSFKFDVLDLTAPFRPSNYQSAVETAYKEGYKCIVVDSATHEHDGDGGYLDMQQEELSAMVERYMKKYPNSKEWEVREKLTPSSWIKPKHERKKMIQALLSCSSTVPIIFCFRAEEKVFSTKDGKLVANNPPIWTPLCGKPFPFEMTVFLLLKPDRPGYPNPIKLQEQHKALFPLDKPLNKESGRLIAQWAAGGHQKSEAQAAGTATPGAGLHPASTLGASDPTITVDQAIEIADLFTEKRWDKAKFLTKHGIKSFEQLTIFQYDQVKKSAT